VCPLLCSVYPACSKPAWVQLLNGSGHTCGNHLPTQHLRVSLRPQRLDSCAFTYV
jgi:hypothetical protein